LKLRLLYHGPVLSLTIFQIRKNAQVQCDVTITIKPQTKGDDPLSSPKTALTQYWPLPRCPQSLPCPFVIDLTS
jgi:hypothetical protein